MILAVALALADEIHEIDWSPDGTRLAARTYDEKLRREEVRIHEGRDAGYGGSIHPPDGELATTWRDSGRLLISGKKYLWQYEFENTWTTIVAKGGFTTIDASPDGSLVAAWSAKTGARLLKWVDAVVKANGDVKKRGAYKVMKDAPASSMPYTWTRGGQLLVTTGGPGAWQLSRCAPDGTCGPPTAIPVENPRVVTGAEGVIVVMAGTRTAETFYQSDVAGDGTIAAFREQSMGVTAVSAISAHPSLPWLALATPSGDVVMWTDVGHSQRMAVGHYRIDALAWSPVAPVLAVDVDGALTLYRADPDKVSDP